MLSLPSPPVIISFPAPPVIISFAAPPSMVSISSPPVIISAPAPPVKVSFPVPPTSLNAPDDPVALDTSIVTSLASFAVKVAFEAEVESFLVSLVAVNPIISIASRLAFAFITTTSSSVPDAPPKSFTISVPAAIVIISFPAPPVIVSLTFPDPSVIISAPLPPVMISIPP